MTRPLAIVACLAAAAATARPNAAFAAVTKEQFDKAAEKLRANAQLWVKDEPIPEADKADLKDLKFDKDSASLLEPLLRTGSRDPEELYVVCKLLSRLGSADAETARAVLPSLKALNGRLRTTYLTFPQLSKAQVQALKMPEYDPRLTTDMIMARMGMVERTRQMKVERDLPVAKYNETVYDVQKQTLALMMRADDPAEDADLVRMMFLEERSGTSLFLAIVNAFADQAKGMSQDRAAKLYAQFRPHVSRLATQAKRGYLNPGKADLRLDDTSEYQKDEAYAGIELIDTMNRLADAAKNPSLKLKAPDKKQIDEMHKKGK